ncbi:hypothetical protein WN943_006818 [Citrus x changshan-huyou]
MDNLKQVDEVDEVEELHDLQEADFEENKEKLVEKVAEPKMWSDLIQKAKDGGLDAIETYILWNAHEPQRCQSVGELQNELDLSSYSLSSKTSRYSHSGLSGLPFNGIR